MALSPTPNYCTSNLAIFWGFQPLQFTEIPEPIHKINMFFQVPSIKSLALESSNFTFFINYGIYVLSLKRIAILLSVLWYPGFFYIILCYKKLNISFLFLTTSNRNMIIGQDQISTAQGQFLQHQKHGLIIKQDWQLVWFFFLFVIFIY